MPHVAVSDSRVTCVERGEAEGAKARKIPLLLPNTLPLGHRVFVHSESPQLPFSDRNTHVSVYTLTP